MPWIESHQTLKEHPKVFGLARRMNWSVDVTLGKLHRFWWWCLDYALNGDLRRYDPGTLAGGIGLEPDQGEIFLSSMIAEAWIDERPYRRIHDWWDYVGGYLQIKYKHNPLIWKRIRSEYKNRSKHRSKNRSLNGSENSIPDRTGPDQTGPDQPDQKKKKQRVTSDEEFLHDLRNNPAYSHVDVDTELSKMDAWLSTRPERTKTRRFIVNWLNRIPKPLLPGSGGPQPRSVAEVIHRR